MSQASGPVWGAGRRKPLPSTVEARPCSPSGERTSSTAAIANRAAPASAPFPIPIHRGSSPTAIAAGARASMAYPHATQSLRPGLVLLPPKFRFEPSGPASLPLKSRFEPSGPSRCPRNVRPERFGPPRCPGILQTTTRGGACFPRPCRSRTVGTSCCLDLREMEALGAPPLPLKSQFENFGHASCDPSRQSCVGEVWPPSCAQNLRGLGCPLRPTVSIRDLPTSSASRKASREGRRGNLLLSDRKREASSACVDARAWLIRGGSDNTGTAWGMRRRPVEKRRTPADSV